jgi:hypothetical protein
MVIASALVPIEMMSANAAQWHASTRYAAFIGTKTANGAMLYWTVNTYPRMLCDRIKPALVDIAAKKILHGVTVSSVPTPGNVSAMCSGFGSRVELSSSVQVSRSETPEMQETARS